MGRKFARAIACMVLALSGGDAEKRSKLPEMATFVRRVFAILGCGLLCSLANPAWSQNAEQCKPYRPTVSSGWNNTEASWASSPEEVCQNVIALSPNPRQISEGTVHYASRGVIQTGPNGWNCIFHQDVYNGDGVLLPQYSGDRNWDGVSGPFCATLRISLSGRSATKAMPAGPALPLVATVTQGGAAAAGKAVSISLSGGGSANSGTTDAAGQYHFTYKPPVFKATTVQLNATCGECINTATYSINVSAAETPQSCFGNPISPANAEKLQTEPDYSDAGAHPLHWTRHYRSRGNLWVGMGEGWAHAYAGAITGTTHETTVQLGDGTRVNFSRVSAAAPWIADNATDTLSETPQGWQYTRASDETRWQLDATGTRLQAITQRNGWTMALAYNAAGQLATITNAFGRSLTLAYNAQGQLTSATTPDGRSISYAHNSEGRLSSATPPDATSRTYMYDNPAWPSGLSGIVDETGQRIATYSYDSLGRATGTTQAGGAQNYSINYPAPDPQAPNGGVSAGTTVDPAIYRMNVQVTDPLGNPQTWTYQGGDGNIRVLGANGAYMGGQVAQRSFAGATTLAQSETDFLGITTLFTWDTARRLKVAETKAASRPEA